MVSQKYLRNAWIKGKKKKNKWSTAPRRRIPPPPPDPSTFVRVNKGNRIKVLFRFTSACGRVYTDRFCTGIVDEVYYFKLHVRFSDGMWWVPRSDPTIQVISSQ